MYSVALRTVGNGEDARDLVQTAFLKAYQNLGSFDPRYRFFSWLYRILRNESINHLSRRHAHQPIEGHGEVRAQEDPQRAVEEQEQVRRVESALARLTPEYREVVLLRHYAELSYEEMAAALGIPEKTVKSRLYSARQRLAGLLGDGEAAPRVGGRA
jgi:RNA polymerase sigma-70 factor, ECF subfamily